MLLATRLFITSCIYSFTFRLLSIGFGLLRLCFKCQLVDSFFVVVHIINIWKSLYLNDRLFTVKIIIILYRNHFFSPLQICCTPNKMLASKKMNQFTGNLCYQLQSKKKKQQQQIMMISEKNAIVTMWHSYRIYHLH